MSIQIPAHIVILGIVMVRPRFLGGEGLGGEWGGEGGGVSMDLIQCHVFESAIGTSIRRVACSSRRGRSNVRMRDIAPAVRAGSTFTLRIRFESTGNQIFKGNCSYLSTNPKTNLKTNPNPNTSPNPNL